MFCANSFNKIHDGFSYSLTRYFASFHFIRLTGSSICVNRLCKFIKMTHSIDMCIIGYSVLWSIVPGTVCATIMHVSTRKIHRIGKLYIYYSERTVFYAQAEEDEEENGKRIDESKWFLFSHKRFFRLWWMYWQNIITKSMKREFFNGMNSTIQYQLCSARTFLQEFFDMPLFFTTYQKE